MVVIWAQQGSVGVIEVQLGVIRAECGSFGISGVQRGSVRNVCTPYIQLICRK